MKQYQDTIKGKLFKYFQDKLNLKQSTKGWWRSDCPYCDGHNTFGVNLENYHTHCFKCEHSSNPVELLMYMERFQTYNEARSFLNIQQEYEAYDRMVIKSKPKEVLTLELPETFKILTVGDSMMGKAARHYLEKRGFSVKKLGMQGVGYCTDGKYAGYIVFPYYSKGKLVYYQGRKYMGYGTKMRNPEEEEVGIGKSSLIYNEDALFIYNKIYAMESITNCLTLGDNAIGLSGKDISPWQMTRILQSPCERIVIILDPDAITKAYYMAMQIVHYKQVKVIQMPNEKDVNDLGKRMTMQIVKETPYQKYMDLLRLKNKTNEGTQSAYNRIRPNYSASRGAS